MGKHLSGRQPIAKAKIYIGSALNRLDTTRYGVGVDMRDFRAIVEEKISPYFEGATIAKASGFWRGRFEPSLTVEVWDAAETRDKLLSSAIRFAHDIVSALDQIAIAVVATGANGKETVTYVGIDTVRRGAVRRHRYSTK